MFEFKPKPESQESNLSRLVKQFDDELRLAIKNGGIASSDEDVAKEATIGQIATRVSVLGNALMDVAAFFGVTLTPAEDLQNGGYPYGFHEAHETAQFILNDVFRKGFPPQLWSTNMVNILVSHIASRMAVLQDEGRKQADAIHQLECQLATARARLDGFVDPDSPTQTPSALSQLVHKTDPRAKPPQVPPPPMTRIEQKPNDFYVIERRSGGVYHYYTPKGKWSSDPLDALRFVSEAEAKTLIKTRVLPNAQKRPFALSRYDTPAWSDLKEFFS